MSIRVVKKEDWSNLSDMPEDNISFDMTCDFTQYNLDILKEGHRPRTMNDKWFVYYDNEKLYLHRSWTGDCIFVLQFDIENKMIHVVANRDKSQYHADSIEEDAKLINGLLREYAFRNIGINRQY